MSRAENDPLESGEPLFGMGRNGSFSTTHWSVVLQAVQNDASGAAALEHLCQNYWYPIYAFIRRRGSSPHQAEDLTQSFFAHLLEKESLAKVDRQKGKFRSFLLGTLKNFLANEWDKSLAAKRGGKRQFISLDAEAGEAVFLQESDLAAPEERLFDRRWALIVVEAVLARLGREYAAAKKEKLFSTLEKGLTEDMPASVYGEWATELGMTQEAVRVALHRLRRRFGKELREEIAQTVSDPSEVDEEIKNLFAAITV